jgi:nucleoside-diphosphate-sugar epimerase
MADILILGGSGFLSGAIARRAVAEGHRTCAVTRGQRNLPPGVLGLVADRRDPAAFARAIDQARTTWDLVIDCIAYSPEDAHQDVAVFSSRARHLVLVSTDFVYHPIKRILPQPENPAVFTAVGYGGKKREAEEVLMASATGAMAWSIVRPSHIYGPGSLPGCLPHHSRDSRLVDHLLSGTPLRLVGGGHFIQHPVLTDDLARTILAMSGNPRTYQKIFNVAGPEVMESRTYYQLAADILQVPLKVEETSVEDHMREFPESAPYLCHRMYDLGLLRATCVPMPDTPLEVGLRGHLATLAH